MLLNRTEIGDMFGVSLFTVDRYVNEGMPFVSRPTKAGKGKGANWQFSSKDCILWFVDRGKKGTKKSAREDVDLRIATAEAITKEIKAAELQKVMVHVDDIVEIQEEQYSVIKAHLTDLPGRLAQPLSVEDDPAAILRILKAEMSQALEAISLDDGPESDIEAADAPAEESESDSEPDEELGEDSNYGY